MHISHAAFLLEVKKIFISYTICTYIYHNMNIQSRGLSQFRIRNHLRRCLLNLKQIKVSHSVHDSILYICHVKTFLKRAYTMKNNFGQFIISCKKLWKSGDVNFFCNLKKEKNAWAVNYFVRINVYAIKKYLKKPFWLVWLIAHLEKVVCVCTY